MYYGTSFCPFQIWQSRLFFFFMFCWPCILIHQCNKNQLDALFILSLFHQLTSTCFGHNCSIPILANRQSTEKHNTYQLLYIYSIPPDDGLQICPRHVEVDWRNKLRINGASGWFLLHRSIVHICYCENIIFYNFLLNPLNAKLNSICHLLVLLGAHLILHISRIGVTHFYLHKFVLFCNPV